MFPNKIAVISSEIEFTNKYSIELAGDNDYINLSTGFGVWGDDSVNFTLAACIKFTEDKGHHIISQQDEEDTRRVHFAYSGSANRLTLYIEDADGNGATVNNGVNPSDGDWHHAVVAVNRSAGTLGGVAANKAQWYVDGSASGSAGDISAVTGDLTGTDNTTKIGAGGKSGSFWQGKLADIAMWDTVLTVADVLKIYNSGTPTDLTLGGSYSTVGNVNNLKGYWTLEEGSGTFVNDSSTSREHGTLIASDDDEWTTDAPS